jgi:hypothetical protein
MPVRVRPVTLWRAEVENEPGALARALGPLAEARTNLQAIMGYRLPGDRGRAAVEIFPVRGAKAVSAAESSGLNEAQISALHIEGENRPGLGHAIAKALADAGINMDFFVGLASGDRHATVIGFDSRDDAERAVPLIKRAAAAERRPATQKTPVKRARGSAKRGARTAARRRPGRR